MEYLRLFNLLFEGLEGFLCLAFKENLKIKGAPVESFFHWPDKIEEIKAWVEEHRSTNCYFCPHLLSGESRRKEYALPGHALYAELDRCQPSSLTKYGEPTFSVIVQTSPGRWQAYWILDQDVSPEQYEALNHRIALGYKKQGCDQSGWNLGKLLRIPGTIHNKGEPFPFTVEVFVIHPWGADSDGFNRLPSLPSTTHRGAEIRGDVPPVEIGSLRIPESVKEYLRTPPPEGERSEAAWAVMLAMKEAGYSPEQIFATIWASPLKERYSAFTLKRDVERAFEKGEEKMMPEKFKGFAGGLEELKEAFPKGETPYLIEGLLAVGGQASALISGESGEGKSTLAEVALVSSTQGKPVFNKHRVPFPLRFALIDYEATQSAIAEDIELMTPVLGAPVPENVLILTPTGKPFDVMNPDCMNWLWAELKRFRPHIVWHDSIYGFVSQLVNDEDRALKVREFCQRIITELDAGVVIGHHTKAIGEFAPKGGFERTMGVLGKRLHQWAATKLTYTFLPEFKGFGILEGSTRIGPWDPIKIILQYHQPTKTVWEIDADMIALSDKEKKDLLGEDPKITEVKRLLLELDMVGVRDIEKAARLGVDKSTVSRWRSGKIKPPEERLRDLRKLAAEVGLWHGQEGTQ